MMQLRLLGTGSPNLLVHRQATTTLLSQGGKHVLIDAGRGVTTQLAKAGVMPHELSAILITHHHYDHIGNLGDLLLTAWHYDAALIPVIGPPGTAQIVQALFEQVYQREIHASLILAKANGKELRRPHEIFPVITIDDGQTYFHGDWQIQAAAVEHGHQLGLSWDEWPCLGYRIGVAGKIIAISGDTVACPKLIALADQADVLVQCCFLPEAMITNAARQRLAQFVIATSGQVGKIATQARVKHLVLTHFSDLSPEMLEAIGEDVRHDYAGPLTLGEDLMLIEA